MVREIRDFLGIKKQSSKQKIQEGQITYYLDDKLEEDPRKSCPKCSSTEITSLHTHNVDGVDYKCNDCKLRYEIIYCDRDEDF